MQRPRISPSDAATNDYFGSIGGMSADGSTALIGASGKKVGSNVAQGVAYVLTGLLTPIDSIGIYRPSTSTFHLRTNLNGCNPGIRCYSNLDVQFGDATKSATNYPIVGDWMGNGVSTIGLYLRNTGFFILRDQNTPNIPFITFRLGNPGDIPLAGRWTSDMTHDGVGVFRPTNGTLYLKKTLGLGYANFAAIMGIMGDIGIVGDWDGDGFDSPGIYRPSQSRFYLQNNSQPNGVIYGGQILTFGVACPVGMNPYGHCDLPIVGDWNGQGFSGVGVLRSSNGIVFLKNTLTPGYADFNFIYGIANDIPLAGHWITTGGAPPPPLNNLIVPNTNVPAATPTAPNLTIPPTVAAPSFDG